jgi:hypothetical protein
MSSTRIPCLIHIPLQYPDGNEVEPETLNKFYEIFDRQFGGSSPLGVIEGRWLGGGRANATRRGRGSEGLDSSL